MKLLWWFQYSGILSFILARLFSCSFNVHFCFMHVEKTMVKVAIRCFVVCYLFVCLFLFVLLNKQTNKQTRCFVIFCFFRCTSPIYMSPALHLTVYSCIYRYISSFTITTCMFCVSSRASCLTLKNRRAGSPCTMQFLVSTILESTEYDAENH